MDNELILFDRLEVIKQANNKYDLEHNSYLSFSGGKDSTLLSVLFDLALPGNTIPRVYIDTGIEYNDIRKFVYDMAKNDIRLQIIKPSVPIRKMLEDKGYPFKSKEHSEKVGEYQKGSRAKSIMEYKNGGSFKCPKKLMCQYEKDYPLKLSSECCNEMKKKPVRKWQKSSHRNIAITGMRREEGGQRNNLNCILKDRDGKMIKFHPLAPISEEWEEWFIEKHNIKLCKLYYEPFNFKRTGCKGCPYSLDLQEQLTIMELYLPNECKQCEAIWDKVYQEYRRLNYRLKKDEQLKLF